TAAGGPFDKGIVFEVPGNLPNGSVNQAHYSETFVGSGGTGTLTYSESGALPAGLTLNRAGVLSGTPKAPGSFIFTVTATDGVGVSASQSYSITINASPITLDPRTLPSWTVNQSAYNQILTASGSPGPYTFTVTAGTLPAGVTLSSAGTMSGTPTSV